MPRIKFERTLVEIRTRGCFAAIVWADSVEFGSCGVATIYSGRDSVAFIPTRLSEMRVHGELLTKPSEYVPTMADFEEGK